MELKGYTRLVGALKKGYCDRWHRLKTYDDGYGELWLCEWEYGPFMLIRARSLDTAYEILCDEMTPIDDSELHEAYGFDSREDFDKAIEDGEEPDLIEGYSYQANATGTGIVNVGHYLWIGNFDPHNRRDIRVVVRHWTMNEPDGEDLLERLCNS